ncbi:hypothetical protein PSTG_04834 [Puccinia striiformis f. sp. tritici PST-78]|uniref:Endonuclease III homolog n=1 Tax=Puccinia striiformis f. sp. tritici PST-78 TaxID=1165861 RepID=A0A0L0VRW3_9BASI|nr:hypothetical protein PSTG_04834 [Puccinia striiformis f. sp. tritici PST-78]
MPPQTRLRAASKSATPGSIKQARAVVSPSKRIKTEQSTSTLPEGKSPIKRKTKTVVKQALLEPVPPPPRWKETYGLIEEQRKTFIAPVDTMGCDKAGDAPETSHLIERSERDRRLSCLVSLMLSSQTKDEVTAQATLNLRLHLKNSLTVDSLREATVEEIAECIKKVGFWNKKAQFIKLMADDLFLKHDSDVPKTLDELVALKGVGPKMAFLALSNAWSINLGIGVDTHVHRISNRLGWVKTNDPEGTRINLESWLPKHLYQDINHLLVGFGQVICLPIGPKCEDCYVGKIGGLCPSSKIESNLTKLRRVKSNSSSPRKVSNRSPSRAHIPIKLEEQEVKKDGDEEEEEYKPKSKSSRFFQNLGIVKQEEEDSIVDIKEEPHNNRNAVDPSSPLTELDNDLDNLQSCSTHQSLNW